MPGAGRPGRPNLPLLIVLGVVALVLIGTVCLGGGYLIGHREPNVKGSITPTPSDDALSVNSPSPSTPTSTPTASAEVTSLSGVWIGGFYCNNEEVRAAMAIAGPLDDLYAVVNFSPATGTTYTTSGSLALTGDYSSGVLSLRFDHWIRKPTIGTSFNLYSTDVSRTKITGNVQASSCSDFAFFPE
jgi:hypothetical protein